MAKNNLNLNSNQFKVSRFDENTPVRATDRLRTLEFVLTDAGLHYGKGLLYKAALPKGVEEDSDGTSILGTPVFSRLQLGETNDTAIETVNYTDLQGNKKTYPVLIMDTVLITVSQQKNIIETVLQGRDGSIKEYISNGEYNILIQGMLHDSTKVTSNYPKSEVDKFIKIMNVPHSISIVSSFLAQFNIEEMVIKSWNFPQQKGVRNVQGFTMEAVSDRPVELVQEGPNINTQ